MTKVSVIIPVYNGERHLRQCLDSVCGQTLKEIEIICVDDGSTDTSYHILEEYQERDARIRLFRQANLYAGTARNLGKANATGEYLAFWDSDDFFELNALEVLYAQAKRTDADVCVCGADQYFQELETLYPNPGYMNANRIPSEEVFNRITNENYILNFTNAAAWNKLFRRDYIEKLKLDFQTVRNGNDVYFTVNAICLADRVTTVPDILIHYRRNQKSGLVSSLKESSLSPVYAWMAIAENLQNQGAFPERSFANKALASMLFLLHNIQGREAFLSAVELLQKEGLRKMHIAKQEDGYYYNKRHEKILHHLLEDTPEDFQAFLRYEAYIELTEASAQKRLKEQELKKRKQEIRRLKKKIKDINESRAYRVCNRILRLPRKIGSLFGGK